MIVICEAEAAVDLVLAEIDIRSVWSLGLRYHTIECFRVQCDTR